MRGYNRRGFNGRSIRAFFLLAVAIAVLHSQPLDKRLFDSMKCLVCIVTLVALASCVPAPHWSTYAPGYEGVARNRNSQPVEGAKVTYRYRNSLVIDECTTKTDGSFELKPLKQFHYLVYPGSPGVAPFPIGLTYSSSLPNSITVSAGGDEHTYWIGSKEHYMEASRNAAAGVASPFQKDQECSWLKPDAKWIGKSPVYLTQ